MKCLRAFGSLVPRYVLPLLPVLSLESSQLCVHRRHLLSACLSVMVVLGVMPTTRWAAAVQDDERVLPLFPLIHSHAQPAKDTLDVDVCWPLVSYHRQPRQTYFGLHPLFSYENDRSQQRKTVDFIWPFCSYRHSRDIERDRETWQTTVIPLFNWRQIQIPELKTRSWTLFPVLFAGSQGSGRTYFIFFPFVWYAKQAKITIPFGGEERSSFFALFPLYGRFENFLQRERIRFYLWPLLSTSRRKEFDTVNICWPFVGISRGPEAIGWRIWPIFTYGKRGKESLTISYLWPLGHYKRLKQPSAKPDTYHVFLPFFGTVRQNNSTLDFVFPFYARATSPTRRTNGYLWPLFSHTVNLRDGYKQINLFWFLFRYRWGEDMRSIRLFPLFSTMSTPDQKQTSILWLLYNYRYSRTKHYSSERRHLFPFLIHKTRTWNDGRKDSRLIILPFFNYWSTKEGEKTVRSLWPFWYVSSSGMERNWEPLWRIYERRCDADGSKEIRVLGRIYHSVETPHEKFRELNLLVFHHRRRNAETHWSVLGGLFGWTKTPSGSAPTLFYHSFR